MIFISAKRNNWIFRLFVSNGDIQMLYKQLNICFSFYSLTLNQFSGLFACFLLHNGYLTKDSDTYVTLFRNDFANNVFSNQLLLHINTWYWTID